MINCKTSPLTCVLVAVMPLTAASTEQEDVPPDSEQQTVELHSEGNTGNY